MVLDKLRTLFRPGAGNQGDLHLEAEGGDSMATLRFVPDDLGAFIQRVGCDGCVQIALDTVDLEQLIMWATGALCVIDDDCEED